MNIFPIEIDEHIISYLSLKEIYKYHICINNDLNIFTQYIKYILRPFYEICENIQKVKWELFDHSKLNHHKGFVSYIFSLFQTQAGCRILFTQQNNKHFLLVKENKNKIIWIEPRNNGYYIQNFYKSLYEKDVCYCDNETKDIVKEKIENIMCV